MNKNILITGAAGFLGSHLTIHHLRSGDNVLGIDNYSSSRENSRHLLFIRELYSPERAMLKKADITIEKDVRDCVNEFIQVNGKKIDIVYNFACPASPPRYQEIPIETLLTCTVGTANILNIAREYNSVLVHASTSEVYGDPEFTPQNELYRGNVNSYGPRSCYDEGKRAAEALCYDYLNKHNVDARLVRIFNTYGPHMDLYDGRVVSNFIVQALKNEPHTVYGGGKQTRSFCYVSDLIRGIVKMAELPENPRTPINIGNPVEFSIIDFANIVHTIINGNKNSNIKDMPLPVDDPMQRCPNIELAKKILDWEPTVSLEDGLKKTIDWFKTELLNVDL